jgi:hypothetical protein
MLIKPYERIFFSEGDVSRAMDNCRHYLMKYISSCIIVWLVLYKKKFFNVEID